MIRKYKPDVLCFLLRTHYNGIHRNCLKNSFAEFDSPQLYFNYCIIMQRIAKRSFYIKKGCTVQRTSHAMTIIRKNGMFYCNNAFPFHLLRTAKFMFSLMQLKPISSFCIFHLVQYCLQQKAFELGPVRVDFHCCTQEEIWTNPIKKDYVVNVFSSLCIAFEKLFLTHKKMSYVRT